MRTILIVLITAGALLTGASNAHTQQNWAGQYRVSGVNPDGTTYEGTATITSLGRNMYGMAWQTGDSYTGFGFVDAKGYLVVGGLQGPLVVSYAPDGSGTWLAPGAPAVATEKLTKQ